MTQKKNKWLPRIFIAVFFVFVARHFTHRLFVYNDSTPSDSTPAKVGPVMGHPFRNMGIVAAGSSPVPMLKSQTQNASVNEREKNIPPLSAKKEGEKQVINQIEKKYRERLAERLDNPVKAPETRIPKDILAKFTTSMGTFSVLLLPQIAPKTVEHFIMLAEGTRSWKSPAEGRFVNKPFYNGLIFHRTVDGYFIQTGDPLKNGTGGPGFIIPDEFNAKREEVTPGMVIMANHGKDTAGSQFFIVLSDDMKDVLNDENTVFGKVVDGLQVVKKISKVKKDIEDKPIQDIFLNEIKIIRIYGKGSEKISTPWSSPAPTVLDAVPKPITSPQNQ